MVTNSTYINKTNSYLSS